MELSSSSGSGGTSSRRMAKRLLRNTPWHLLLIALAIASLGVWNLASASRNATPIWRSQVDWILVGLATSLSLILLDYRYLLRLAYPVYGFVVIALFAVLLKGHSAMGAQRWLDFGPIHLQPSELMKIGIVLVLARFFHEDADHKDGYMLRNLWLPGILVLVPFALVMKQPDLGTAMIIAAVAGTMILFAKVRWQSLLIATMAFLIMAGFAWTLALKDYQKRRVSTFLNPEADLLGAGYHASQSLIAVGSGQVWGKGWSQGTQTQLSFLPEQHTDFIFSVWGEEHGLVGAAILIGLYLLLVLSTVDIASEAREKFGIFVSVGISAMLFWHVFINIGMVTGLLPVVGVTLPLMSYGGSSVLTVFAGLGLLMNICMRRHLF